MRRFGDRRNLCLEMPPYMMRGHRRERRCVTWHFADRCGDSTAALKVVVVTPDCLAHVAGERPT